MTSEQWAELAVKLTNETGINIAWGDEQFTIGGHVNTTSRLLTFAVSVLEVMCDDEEWSTETMDNIVDHAVDLALVKDEDPLSHTLYVQE